MMLMYLDFKRYHWLYHRYPYLILHYVHMKHNLCALHALFMTIDLDIAKMRTYPLPELILEEIVGTMEIEQDALAPSDCIIRSQECRKSGCKNPEIHNRKAGYCRLKTTSVDAANVSHFA